jgi:translation initiation factor 6
LSVGSGSLAGSPYLGVFCRAGETLALLPPTAPAEFAGLVSRCLGVPAARITVGGIEVVGSLVAFNSRGAVLPDYATDEEMATLAKVLPVHRLGGRINALGNTILVNDRGAVVHPEYTAEQRDAIASALGVPVVPSTVAGLGTVAMAAVATNLGVVVHPRITAEETAVLESTLKVPVHKSTANFGIPLVGACLAANSRGMVVGDQTTPVELVHLEDGLKVFD